jgi:hypothetical protein
VDGEKSEVRSECSRVSVDSHRVNISVVSATTCNACEERVSRTLVENDDKERLTL